jgi:hypothetical protein
VLLKTARIFQLRHFRNKEAPPFARYWVVAIRDICATRDGFLLSA